MTVSYVLTVYNKAKFLGDVLAAVARERAATGGEIIIVDDGSTDGSAEAIASFAEGHSGVVVRRRPNGGVAAATNDGVRLATSRYVRIVDGDDILTPGSTAGLVRALEVHDVGLAYGRLAQYRVGSADPSGHRVDGLAPAAVLTDALKRVLTSQPFIPSAALMSREAVERCVPLPERYRTSQDFILAVRMARTTRFAALDQVCCLAPIEAEGRLSSSMAHMYSDTAHLLADEIESTSGWSSQYVRFAAQRMAARASRYAHRHVGAGAKDRAWLAWWRHAGRLPFVRATPATLRRIASAYAADAGPFQPSGKEAKART